MLLAALRRWLFLLLLWAALAAVPAGPKSGALGRCSWPRGLLMTLGQTNQKTPRRRGEGSRCAIPPREGVAPTIVANQTPQKSYGKGLVGPHGATLPPRAVKRSYRRALARARHAGWTFYRGQLLTLPKLGAPEPCQPLQFPRPHPGQLLPKASSRRASVVTWNAGGLTTEVYHDMLAWLCSQKVDIALLQGTRWREERTWRTHGYSIIQSGEDPCSSPSHGGLMIFIFERICNFDAISYSVLLPGRLMHVKCRVGEHNIDIVNLHQYPDAHNQSRLRPTG